MDQEVWCTLPYTHCPKQLSTLAVYVVYSQCYPFLKTCTLLPQIIITGFCIWRTFFFLSRWTFCFSLIFQYFVLMLWWPELIFAPLLPPFQKTTFGQGCTSSTLVKNTFMSCVEVFYCLVLTVTFPDAQSGSPVHLKVCCTLMVLSVKLQRLLQQTVEPQWHLEFDLWLFCRGHFNKSLILGVMQGFISCFCWVYSVGL